VQRHGNRRNEIIYHAEARCLSREKVIERVFQLRQKLRAFLARKGHPLSINFQGNFWFYLNLNSLLCIVQPFTDEEFDLGCTPVATETQKTAMTRHTKLNESWSCTLRSCTTPSVNKKKRISFIMNAAAEFHPPVVKNGVLTLFQGILS